MTSPHPGCDADCVQRRGFMKTTAASVAVMLLADVFPGKVAAQDAETKVPVATFARKRIARLSELSEATPIEFNFPSAAIHTNCMLFKLGKAAGGGVGDDDDIVAFSARCTHMGGDLSRGYIKDHQLVGCGEHLTTFDLTRHGIMVAGHATDRLPQILLEIEGDEIFATGIVGLLYGYAANPISQHSKSEAE